jgi:hypothetical protein
VNGEAARNPRTATARPWLARKDAADSAHNPSSQGELAHDAGFQASEQNWGAP